MVDGVGSADVGHLLLDTTPDAAPVAPSPPSTASRGGGGGAPSSLDADRPTPPAGPTTPGSLARVAHAWAGLLPVDTISRAAEMGAHGVLHPRDALRSARSALAVIVREELRAAPRTSLNVPIGTLRRFEVRARPARGLEGDQERSRRHDQRCRTHGRPRAGSERCCSRAARQCPRKGCERWSR